MNKLVLVVLLLLVPMILWSQVETSKFIKIVRRATGQLVTALDVDLYEAGTANKLYDLTETSTGLYEHGTVGHGLYDIYVDDVLEQEDFWVGGNRISIVVGDTHFNSSGRMLQAGIEDSVISLSKFTSAAIAFISSGGTINNNPDDISIKSNLIDTTLYVDPTWIDTSKHLGDRISDSLGDFSYSLTEPIYVRVDSLITLDLSEQDTAVQFSGGINPSTKGPAAYRFVGVHDRTYLTFLSYDGYDGEHERNYVMFYEHLADTMSDIFEIPANANANDAHIHGSIIVSDSGYILVAQDSVYDYGHNKGIQILRSTNIEDISSWEDMGRVHATDYSAYPQFIKTPDGVIHLIVRYGLSSLDHWRIMHYSSSDDGKTWDNRRLILRVMDASSYLRAYNTMASVHPDSQIIALSVRKMHSDSDPGQAKSSYRWHFFVWSRDAITWYNANSSWSKNVESSGIITKSELNTYCLIDSVVSTVGEVVCMGTWHYGDQFYFMVDTTDTLRGNPHTSDLVYWDNSTRISRNFPLTEHGRNDSSLYVIPTWVLPYGDGFFDMAITFNDTTFPGNTNTRRSYSIYRTRNYGIDWNEVKLMGQEDTQAYNYQGGAWPVNYMDSDFKLFPWFYVFGSVDTDSDIKMFLMKKYIHHYGEE